MAVTALGSLILALGVAGVVSQAQAQSRPLTEQDKKAGELQAELARLRQDRDGLTRERQKVAADIQASEGRLTAIENRKDELRALDDVLRTSLEERYVELSKLLASMQRMGRNPPPVMITRREDIISMMHSAKLLGQVYPEVQQRAAALAAQVKALAEVRAKAEEESKRERVEALLLTEKQTKLGLLIELNNQMEATKQAEFAQLQRKAADIAKSAEKIDDLAAATDKLDKGVADATRLGDYDRGLAQPGAAAPGQPPVLAGAPKAGEPSAPAPTKHAALPPQKPLDARPPPVTLDVGGMAPRTQAPIEPRVAFHLARGKLPMPASGRRVISFGERTSRGPALGISIETRFGAQVTSPADGWVVYAGEFRTYGQVLIINAGGGHHILLANLSQLNVTTGQFLLAGEPVGTMVPAPKSVPGRVQSGGPVLYVEFRKDQKPIDPDPWWMDPPKRNADAGDVRRLPPQFSRG